MLMSLQAQTILQQIEQLNPSEIYWIYEELLIRLQKMQKIQQILAQIQGLGKGVWNLDAQSYINHSRNEDY